MLYFSPWKKALIALVCLAGAVFSAPNIAYEAADSANRARADIERIEDAGGTASDELKEAAAAWPSFLPSDVVNLGLDLRGGAHLLVEVQVEDVIAERMVALVSEAREALREAGVRRWTGLEASGAGMSVRITGADDVEIAGEVLRGLAQPVSDAMLGVTGSDISVTLGEDQTYLVEMTEPAIAALNDRTMAQSLEIMRRRIDETGTREPTIQRQGERRILIQVPGIGSAEELLSIIGKTAKLTFHLVESQTADGAQSPGPGNAIYPDAEDPGFYIVERRAIVTGERLVDAQLGFDGRTGEPVVNFRFDTAGARRFGEVTAANVGRPFAVVLDGAVITAPVIRDAILGGSGQISGSFTTEGANQLAILLRAGALPAEISVLEQRTVGPDLGADSVRAGEFAVVFAFAAVLVFMVLTYGRFGVFANVALIVNVALIMAVLSVLGATLTLPGIAGIVLTIGMAVDANVLIFERIREELRKSKGVARAIEAGYERAYSAIVDANVTTFLAAVILFAMGSGPVKGFAVTLGVGIVTSVFTAVVVTRLIVSLWFERARPKTLEI